MIINGDLLEEMLRLFYCLLFPVRAFKKKKWKSGREGGSSSLGNPVRGRGQKCLPSIGGVCIFSGITQCRVQKNETLIYLAVISQKCTIIFKYTQLLPSISTKNLSFSCH